MHCIRQYIGLLLVVILCFNLAGYQIILRVRQHRIRVEMEQMIRKEIPDSELTLIVVDSDNPADAANLQWVEDHEFRYKGQMYDLVRREQKGNQVRLYCISDERETTLLSEADNWIRQKDQNSSTENNLLQLMVKVLPLPTYGWQPEFQSGNIISFPEQQDQLMDGIIKIPSPPPRLAA